MDNSIAVRRLEKIQEEGLFTRSLQFEEFIEDLCKRYARLYNEILPVGNYLYIIEKLEEKGLID